MLKIGLVYTSTTLELIELVEKEVKTVFEDQKIEIISFEDPSILALTRELGYAGREPAVRLMKEYVQAAEAGVDIILNICSSVGEVADAAQDFANFASIPIVKIDGDMALEAVKAGNRVGVLATLQTTLDPTKKELIKQGRYTGRVPELVDGLIDGAFGLDQEQFKELLVNKAKEIQDQVDVILLAQGSMAYCADLIEKETGLPTFASPYYGARALRKKLAEIGKIKVASPASV